LIGPFSLLKKESKDHFFLPSFHLPFNFHYLKAILPVFLFMVLDLLVLVPSYLSLILIK
jgi:hypothetical protein